MAKAKKKRPRKPKQELLDDPVFVQQRIRAVDDAADNYYEVMQERCVLSKEEDEKKTALIEIMKEHGIDRYETADGLVVTITAKSNVKCKKKDVEEGTDDYPEDEGEDKD